MKTDIYINGMSSLSALGHSEHEIWNSYLSSDHSLRPSQTGEWVGAVSDENEKLIETLRSSHKNYKKLDRTVLMALLVSGKLAETINLDHQSYGVNIGSSRGATGVFEDSHKQFINHNKTPTLTSPSTTLGNISSWVSQHLSNDGPVLSHSVTCSTAMHALLNGVAWMNSGMQETFLVGGSEAPLTDFTLSQMKALNIYANKDEKNFPCRALDLEKASNSMVLGEAAIALFLEKECSGQSLAKIAGIGFGNETIRHASSLSSDALCLQRSMTMALEDHQKSDVDVVITHTPGTKHGDQAEIEGITKVFKDQRPAITTNKWKLGHSLGSSGLMSVELALLMIKHQKFIEIPYLKQQKKPDSINKILINSVGFGGNAVSVLLERV
jgi:3-oxoacyl-[acyl-carrier-protein] synthase II